MNSNLQSAVPHSLHCPKGRLAHSYWKGLSSSLFAAFGGYGSGYSTYSANKYPNGSKRQWGLGKRRDCLEVMEVVKIWG